MENLKTGIIIQARLGSLRLPNKPLLKLYNGTVLSHLLDRLKKCKKIDLVVVAIPKNSANHLLKVYLEKNNYNIFEGDENNVLSRYYHAAKKYNINKIIRLTADCPFHDPALIDNAIDLFNKKNLDFLCNYDPPTFPDGYDLSISTFEQLKDAFKSAKSPYDREHVVPYLIRKKKIKKMNIESDGDFSNLRLTIYEKKDYEFLIKMSKYFKTKRNFNYEDIKKTYKKNKSIFDINSNINRDEGSELSKEQKIWKRAKQIIPGGNMLFSKRPERFLPGFWPTYFNKAKGVNVWTLSGKKYIDMSLMGVGTNILGYSNSKINTQVLNAVKKGNISTLNSYEEVKLAEKLIEMHPWFDMARFTRSGGEANAVAIRIARAYTRKDGVAICGYHGWHDWYLAANLKEKSGLNQHLLSDLNISGVPKNLKSTVYPFKFNDYENLIIIITKYKNIGTIKMEVYRNVPPNRNFLQKVRNLCNRKNLVLIFDECTSGFRQTFGGIHKFYNVNPDMAIFGKAMGNGYPINAILGKKEIMNAAQSTFISSTFWTERLGYVAALKTLEIMEKEKSWQVISSKGRYVKRRWKSLINKYKIKAMISGLDAMPKINFLYKEKLIFKTYITQEMLKKGYLTDDAIYLSTEHSKKIIDLYLRNLEKVFKKIKTLKTAKNLKKHLLGEICHDNFKRLN